MQFVHHGPDIPERLLQAHEDGLVVFFCGAGISYPACLPGFAGLAKKLYDALQTTPNAVQKAAFRVKQFDTAVGLLEANIVGGREKVRRELPGVLTPNLKAKNATASHEALLTLGRNNEGRTRLITTNFDRLFEEVISQKSLAVARFLAPLLPVPKNRWDGLVYLHGLLSPQPTANELDRLVLSSGDFGLAYLTERWAARFVSELFRNYTVCFVGYSINDAVLRYMMDALAADRLLGEQPPEMFAFGSHTKGKEEERANEWRAKNVTPILYREHKSHAYLHNTLLAWAESYRDGSLGKERIVVMYAKARPSLSTEQDDFVGRLLWALSDWRGVPAKRFAELDPVPSLEWLKPLSEGRYRQTDLGRFGVPPNIAVDEKLAFSIMRRPSPYTLAAWMTVMDEGACGSRWDEVMRQLGRWLSRHLDDTNLLLWLVNHGGKTHTRLVFEIEQRLDGLARLESEGNTNELARIRANAPNAIPGPLMRTLWGLVLSGRVKYRVHELNLYRWRIRFKREGLTTSLRMALRESLTPRISLSLPFRRPYDNNEGRQPEHISELVAWEIVLSTEYVHSGLRDLAKDECWNAALPELLSDFGSLLRDTLDLMRELGGAEERSDLSSWHQPSISEHPQNKHYHDWTALIDLVRDAWLATAANSPERARLAAEAWWHTPYPLFRRLAFFAASQDQVIPHRRGLDWLLADQHWWMWSVETNREAMRLLVALAPQLDEAMLGELVQAILAGPPRAMFKDDMEPERRDQRVDWETWRRLVKIVDTGVLLNTAGRGRLEALSASYPKFQLQLDQRDEFLIWQGEVQREGEDNQRQQVVTPRRRRELIDYLKKHPNSKDDFRQRCRDNFATTACALYALASQGDWVAERWREGLQAWREEKLAMRSWRYLGPVLAKAPEDVLQALADDLSWWLQTISETFDCHEADFFVLIGRVLDLDHQERIVADDPVMRAINHPVGHVTAALLCWWCRQSLQDGQGLLAELVPIFSRLCDTQHIQFRHGRVVLANNAITLFRVDPDWTSQHLLPLFEWQRSATEAQAAWQGFLRSARHYRPLMELLNQDFLNTASYYTELGEHGGPSYASLLTFAALEPGDTFTRSELALATRTLPPDGLHQAAKALVIALEGAGDQRTNYWRNRINPYLKSIWPTTLDIRSAAISASFALLCVASHDAFPEALDLLRSWLLPQEHPDYLVHKLHEAQICSKFSRPALEFLKLVIDCQAQWPPSDLNTCLNVILEAEPELRHDQNYNRLMEYLRIQRTDVSPD